MMILLRQGFGLNTNLFETNILNLAVVLFVVIKFVGDSLRTLLDQRRQTILATLQEIDKKAREAQQRLNEAERSLEQARLRAQEIRKQTTQTIEREVSAIQQQLKSDLDRLQESGRQTVELERQRAIYSISSQISDLAMISAEDRLLNIFKSQSTSQKQLNEINVRDKLSQLNLFTNR
jgi:F-type H+-transporting ATPase subunit b